MQFLDYEEARIYVESTIRLGRREEDGFYYAEFILPPRRREGDRGESKQLGSISFEFHCWLLLCRIN